VLTSVLVRPHAAAGKSFFANKLTCWLWRCLCSGYVWQTAENEWGHAVVATALSVVDDTSLVSKTILGELKVIHFMALLHHQSCCTSLIFLPISRHLLLIGLVL
jgi:hypothetical protein